MRTTALLAAFVLAPLTPAVVQERLPLEPGERVRVSAPTLGINKLAATFEAIEGDRLILVTDSTITIPLASVTRLDAHRGRHSHPWRGGGMGCLAGVTIGAAVVGS